MGCYRRYLAKVEASSRFRPYFRPKPSAFPHSKRPLKSLLQPGSLRGPVAVTARTVSAALQGANCLLLTTRKRYGPSASPVVSPLAGTVAGFPVLSTNPAEFASR